MTRLMVIPAAGAGSRLGAAVPKLLVPVAGRPMLDHLLALYANVIDHFVVVVSPQAFPLVSEHIRPRAETIDLAIQTVPTGMLDAVLAADTAVSTHQPDRVWITWCDQVAVSPQTVKNLIQTDTAGRESALHLPTCTGPDPYIHLRRDAAGRIDRVLQRREGDAMPPIGESDMGLFSLSRRAFLIDLKAYAKESVAGGATRERNFLPFIPWLARRSSVVTFACANQIEAIGINTPQELRLVEAHLRAVQAETTASGTQDTAH